MGVIIALTIINSFNLILIFLNIKSSNPPDVNEAINIVAMDSMECGSPNNTSFIT